MRVPRLRTRIQGQPTASRLRTPGVRRVVVGTVAGPIVVRATEGDGERALLLIHGAAGSWTTWQPMLQLAEAQGRPLGGVVAVDLPGWGESADPPVRLDAETAATAMEQVVTELGFRRWTVVGHSLGGVVALALAARRPEAATGVVLVSPTGPAVLEAIRRPVLGGLRLPWFAGMLLAMHSLAALPGGGRGVIRQLGRLHAFGSLAAPLFTTRVPRDVAAAFSRELRPAAFVRAARAAGSADLSLWARIRCPVRSVRGQRDVFAGPRDAAALAHLIPDFSETVLPDAGHFATVERPDAILAALDAAAR